MEVMTAAGRSRPPDGGDEGQEQSSQTVDQQAGTRVEKSVAARPSKIQPVAPRMARVPTGGSKPACSPSKSDPAKAPPSEAGASRRKPPKHWTEVDAAALMAEAKQIDPEVVARMWADAEAKAAKELRIARN